MVVPTNTEKSSNRLEINGLTELLATAKNDPFPPVEQWDPPYCGDIGLRIEADGTWHYRDSAIKRAAMTRLFSRVLRCDADGRHFLVTPVEKIDVAVVDAPFVAVEIGDDIEACRAPVKREMALYIGGMGARDKNFYNDYAKKLGYEAAAVEIQDHFLAGRRAEAEAAVPNELVDAVALVGPKERVLERIGTWKDAAAKGHIDTMVVRRPTRVAMRVLAEAVL